MLHHVAHTIRGRALFQTWSEGRALWDRVTGAVPGARALCLMPDHVHVLHEHDVKAALGRALNGHARWLNARQGRSGPLVRESPDPRPIVGPTKIRRQVRYVHLNPCRAGLTVDPISWPFSTHLDALGLAADPVVPRHPDPQRLHAYVSSDPHVHVAGTELPIAPGHLVDLPSVLRAVSLSTRTPASDVLARRGPARTLFLGCARALTPRSPTEIASFAGVSRATAWRVDPIQHRAVASLAADPRAVALDDVELARDPDRYFRVRSCRRRRAQSP